MTLIPKTSVLPFELMRFPNDKVKQNISHIQYRLNNYVTACVECVNRVVEKVNFEVKY